MFSDHSVLIVFLVAEQSHSTAAIISHNKEQMFLALATKHIPLSDFKLHRASEGTIVGTWPVSSAKDLESPVALVCDGNEFMTSRR